MLRGTHSADGSAYLSAFAHQPCEKQHSAESQVDYYADEIRARVVGVAAECPVYKAPQWNLNLQWKGPIKSLPDVQGDTRQRLSHLDQQEEGGDGMQHCSVYANDY